jgi:hypothetical protein
MFWHLMHKSWCICVSFLLFRFVLMYIERIMHLFRFIYTICRNFSCLLYCMDISSVVIFEFVSKRNSLSYYDYRSHTHTYIYPSVYQVFYLLNSSKTFETCKMINILLLQNLQNICVLRQFACILKRNVKIEIWWNTKFWENDLCVIVHRVN